MLHGSAGANVAEPSRLAARHRERTAQLRAKGTVRPASCRKAGGIVADYVKYFKPVKASLLELLELNALLNRKAGPLAMSRLRQLWHVPCLRLDQAQGHALGALPFSDKFFCRQLT